MVAAMVREADEMSTTSTTGVRVSGGDVRGRGEAVATDLPVVQAHHALDDGEVGAGGAVQQQRHEAVLADEVRVEVAAGAAGGERVVAGVDVVGADLVAADGVAGAGERGHQPGGDGGLAVAGGGRGDDEPGEGYHARLTIRCLAGPSARRPSGA